MAWQNKQKAPIPAPTCVQIVVTRLDLVLGNTAIMLLTPQIYGLFVGFSAIVSFMKTSDVVAFMLYMIYLSVVGFGGGLAFGVINAFLNPRIKRGALGVHTFTVKDEGLFEETAFNATLHRWPSLDKVSILFGRLMVRVSGTQWHILPVRAFATIEEAHAFATLLRQRIRA